MKLFSKADSLVDNILSCPHIKLSKSQTLILDGIEVGIFLSDLLNNCVVRTQMFQTFIYFTWRRWYTSDSDSESECQS